MLVKPLDAKWFMTDAELAEEKRLAHERAVSTELVRSRGARGADRVNVIFVVLAWAAVGFPLAWGVYRTWLSVAKFFAS